MIQRKSRRTGKQEEKSLKMRKTSLADQLKKLTGEMEETKKKDFCKRR